MIGPVSHATPLAAFEAPQRREKTERPTQPGQLTEAEQKRVAELKARDQEVRAHEQAHAAAAGPYANGISYSYTTGPDGRRYATSGSTSIDSSPVPGDPRATIQKAQTIRRAATAPAEPSGQDRRVAADAAAMAAAAQKELLEGQREERATGATGAVAAAIPGAGSETVDPQHARAAGAYGAHARSAGSDATDAGGVVATVSHPAAPSLGPRALEPEPDRVDRIDLTA